VQTVVARIAVRPVVFKRSIEDVLGARVASVNVVADVMADDVDEGATIYLELKCSMSQSRRVREFVRRRKETH